jgi:hypothetical protein
MRGASACRRRIVRTFTPVAEPLARRIHARIARAPNAPTTSAVTSPSSACRFVDANSCNSSTATPAATTLKAKTRPFLGNGPSPRPGGQTAARRKQKKVAKYMRPCPNLSASGNEPAKEYIRVTKARAAVDRQSDMAPVAGWPSGGAAFDPTGIAWRVLDRSRSG